MSKKRYIDTKIWRDDWFEELTPQPKLLFIYLLTNEAVDLCGIYEITKRRIKFETSLSEDNIKRLLKAFEGLNKVYYIDGFIVIPNFIKHLNTNPNIIKGIQRSFDEIPGKIWEKIKGFKRLTKALIAYSTLLNLTLPNLSGTGKARRKKKTMYEEEIIHVDDLGEEMAVIVKKTTFGKYPALIANYYCKLTNKRAPDRQLTAAKDLMLFAQEDFPDKPEAKWYKEVLTRIEIADKHYKNNNINSWNLSKVAENWDIIFNKWQHE